MANYAASRNKIERDQSREEVLHVESLVYISTAIVVTVAEVESRTTFRETCRVTKVQNCFMKPNMLHAATSAETQLVKLKM